jgi:hypothetical protein
MATGLPKVPLAGLEERLRQIAASSIRPAPAFRVVAITEQVGDAHGVLAVLIPPSSSAPHEVDGRFPRRDGTTTGRLSEPEIDRLYQLRRHASGPISPAADLLEIVDHLPGYAGDADVRKWRGGLGHGIGVLRVACRIAGDSRHPADPWLREPLVWAVDRAHAWCQGALDGSSVLLAELQELGWEPDGVDGWSAGRATTAAATLFSRETAAAVLRYPAHQLWQVTLPLTRARDVAEQLDYACARERQLVRELMATLHLAGQWACDFEAAGRVQVAVELAGFKDAKPFEATRGRAGVDTSDMVGAPSGITATVPTSSLELRDAPTDVARRLIDRWLAAFCPGGDVYTDVLRQPSGPR